MTVENSNVLRSITNFGLNWEPKIKVEGSASNSDEEKQANKIQSYDDIFNEKIKEFRALMQNGSHPDFDTTWHATIDNFSRVRFPEPKYENEIFNLFKLSKDQFEWTNSRLLGDHMNLEVLFNSEGDVSERIKALTLKILDRQNLLHSIYEKSLGMEGDFFKQFSWETIFHKMIENILDKTPFENSINKIIGIWNKSSRGNPLRILRCQVYCLSCLNVKETEVFSIAFNAVKATLVEIATSPEKKNSKDIFEILSLVDFKDEHVKEIFDTDVKMLIDFKIDSFYRACKKLKIAAKTNVDDTILLFKVQANLNFLGTYYSSDQLEKSSWDVIYNYCELLPISNEKKKTLLEIFLHHKKLAPASSSYLYGIQNALLQLPNALWSSLTSKVKDGESRWKGDKYLTMLQSIRQWCEDNQAWINDMLNDHHDNTILLKNKVEAILTNVRDMKFPELPINPTQDQRRVYNAELRKMNREHLSSLRIALETEDCQLAFERFSAFGKEETSGCALILMALCQHRFTGINMVPFMLKFMEEMITIGLKQLAEKDTCYLHFLNRNFFKNPLDIGNEMIHTAIEHVPEEHKTPLVSLLGWKFRNITNNWDPQMQGSPNINLLEMYFKIPKKPDQKVTWLRFSTPTNSNKINPEFKAFILDKRVLLMSLQSSEDGAEATRTKKLLELNSNQTFITVLPVSNSSLFNQNKENADPSPDVSAFTTKVSFFNSIMEKIFPDQKTTQAQANRYLFPKSWVGSNNFKAKVEECLNLTNEVFFNNLQTLTLSQRRAFIKLFDVVLAFMLIKHTKVEYFAFLCNHSADRTGIFVTLMLEMNLIAFSKENSPIEGQESHTWKQFQEAFIDGVPLIVAKREMNEFHEGLVEALEILKDENVRKKLREQRDKILGVSDFKFSFSSQKQAVEEKKGKIELTAFDEYK